MSINMENENRNTPKDQEVDFEPLIAWFLNRANAISRFFKLLTDSAINEWRLISVFSVIGLILGAILYFSVDKIYQTRALIRISDISNHTCFNAVQMMNELIDDESYQSLATLLNLEEDKVEDLYSITYLDMLGEEVEVGDTVQEGQDFFVVLEAYNNTDMSLFETSILNYLNDLPLASEDFNKRKQIIISKLDNLNSQLSQMDSLKKVVEKSLEIQGKGSGLIYGEPINPVTVHQEARALHSEKIGLEQELRVMKPVKLVIPFVTNEKPVFPRLRHVAGIAAIMLLLGWIIACRRTLRAA
ncbi:hypothetical protein KFE98_04410 [bacterium SCSIO 12741]|nr:hypothetical protein KFE98_04410 [bacterium SCSIO 12741]